MILRVRLIGTAKVVSVESPVWFLNASSTSFQLHLKDSDDKDIFSTAAPHVHIRIGTKYPNMPSLFL